MHGSFKLRSLLGGLFFGTWAMLSVGRDALRERVAQRRERRLAMGALAWERRRGSIS